MHKQAYDGGKFTEVKQRRIGLVLEWVTIKEDRALWTPFVGVDLNLRPTVYIPSSCWHGRKANQTKDETIILIFSPNFVNMKHGNGSVTSYKLTVNNYHYYVRIHSFIHSFIHVNGDVVIPAAMIS